MTSIPGDFANARRCCVDDTCNHNMEVVNEIDTLPELPKDKSQRINRKLYKKNGRKCKWNGKKVIYNVCSYVGCVKEPKNNNNNKYCYICNQTIEIENIDIDDIKKKIKTQDNIKLSDLIKDRYGKWSFFKNHIIYALWLGKTLGYKTKEDWYDITFEQIHSNGGVGLLTHYYKGSPQEFVMTVFPDYDWDQCKFSKVPNGYWQELDNHKHWAEDLGKKLKYTTMENWYNITVEQIHKNGGKGLLGGYYNNSLQAFVKAVFPDYDWDPCKFSSVPNGHWQELDNHKHWAEDLGKTLGYKTKEDWYDITAEQIHKNGGGGLLPDYYKDSPQAFVMTVFPDYDWDPSKFNKHKTEAIVEKFLRINYQIETQKKFEWTEKKRFDFYIEELKIIIELDGAQHFRQVANWVSPEEQQQNDIYKMKKALDHEISVIRILQEDVYYDRIKWEEEIENKIEVIKQSPKPTIQYICSNNEYEKHKELYENHE